ncbi:unnamed protein product [Linum tenue]|uniref:Embryo defective 2759 n=1 Tax=Linum tenue TaxID=586396 RepID=A0AAV0QPH4_9ROSI|nr:unnamed protein product [Linum tenue]
MALATHQMRGSYVGFPSRPSSWSRGVKLKQHVMSLHMVGRLDRHFSANCYLHSSSSVKSWNISVEQNSFHSVGTGDLGLKAKILQVSSFQGSAKNSDAGGRSSGSKGSKNDNGEGLRELPNAQSLPISYTSEPNEGVGGSPAIHNLFKKWLNMLRSHSSSQVADVILEEPAQREEEVAQQTQSISQETQKRSFLFEIFHYFWQLDATIKIPILIFIPLYLGINTIYGVEVSKELTPLWVLGPLVAALYVKLLQGIWALYVFSFRQTVHIVKNLPTYYQVACSYIAGGKLKQEIGARFIRPIVTIKNADHKEMVRQRMMVLKEWLTEKYLDFVESIWPYYCRTIRFLKRANLI